MQLREPRVDKAWAVPAAQTDPKAPSISTTSDQSIAVQPSRQVGDGSMPSAVGRYVALLVAAAVVSVIVTLWAVPVLPVPSAALLATLTAGGIVAQLVHVRISHQGVDEAASVNELGFVPMMVLLPPFWAVAVAAVAAVVGEVVRTRGGAQKVAFNTAWQMIGVAAGAGAFHALAGPRLEMSAGSMAAALVAAGAFVAVNEVSFGGLVAVASRRSLRSVLRGEGTASLLINGTLAATAVLVSLLAVAAPYAIPLLALPGWVLSDRLRARSEAMGRVAAERNRFELTVQGVSDGVALVDADGRVQVWNAAMTAMTGTDAARVLGASLEDAGLAPLAGVLARGRAEVTIAGRVLDVRVTGLAEWEGALLSVRDVTKEAELAQLREELVMRISHEIRTPVTTVAGFVETLDGRWDDLDDDRRHELVRAARRGSDRLGGLVANLLAWARIERGAPDSGSSSALLATPAGPVLRDLVEGLGAPVVVRAEPSLAVPLSPQDLRLVAGNLLANAVTYGQPPVEVDVRRRGGDVVLSVLDHGPGIPADVLPDLFAPFTQGTDGLQRTAKGLGLGLAVVRAVVMGSGGTVDVASDASGTVVRVTWPAAAGAVATAHP